jgi:hypothetical protein
MNFTDASAPVNFPKLIKCRRALRPNMVRDGSKKWHFFKSGTPRTNAAHDFAPLHLHVAGTGRREKRDSFPHEVAACGMADLTR